MNAVLKRLALLPLAALLMAAAVLVDPQPVQAPNELTTKEVGQVLRKTLVARGWLINKDQGNEVVATLPVRSHSLTMRFTQRERQIAMAYVDSVNLDYKVRSNGTRVIHRKYAGWMQNFAVALMQDFQRAVYAKSAT